MTSEDKLQQVINADLFSSTPSVDGLRQVLQFMEPHAQPLSTPQLQALAYLNYLGMRDLHAEFREKNKGKHPYTNLVKWIMDSAISHADPGVFLRTIEAVLPPSPVVTAGDGKSGKRRR
ncbi:hypothetical protein [Alicyclobacillus sp. SP_1]|jgi:hypothetical protein|uniref:hypothetical protein n=1 Tax=Alicyclobacillus sp. SP_1 TaxID=2942475 RepID=UPI0021579C79|nr:hypothetical protein [Alicyclobacillus sp. SP_1]